MYIQPKKFPVQLTFPLSQEQQPHFSAAQQPRFVGGGIPVTFTPCDLPVKSFVVLVWCKLLV